MVRLNDGLKGVNRWMTPVQTDCYPKELAERRIWSADAAAWCAVEIGVSFPVCNGSHPKSTVIVREI